MEILDVRGEAESMPKLISKFESIDRICSTICDGEVRCGLKQRPFVTLSFAQSLDGSIALEPSAPVKLSNHDTQIFTHHLRAAHEAILIGIGTLIADDPQLNVRLVPGKDPQPVVLDGSLRFPLHARLLCDNQIKPWIAATSLADEEKIKKIEKVGGSVFITNGLANGWINLGDLLELLYMKGIRSLMVEGGARIITSFLRENLADQIVITVTPLILGGFRGVSLTGELSTPFISGLHNIQYEKVQDNLIIWGNLKDQKHEDEHTLV
jgi:3,4-dihydroxy 2-butanone 4-phosphate synthase/GTP cyclohydrolase II